MVANTTSRALARVFTGGRIGNSHAAPTPRTVPGLLAVDLVAGQDDGDVVVTTLVDDVPKARGIDGAVTPKAATHGLKEALKTIGHGLLLPLNVSTVNILADRAAMARRAPVGEEE